MSDFYTGDKSEFLEERELEFIPLAIGWFNYYETDGKVYRQECPGFMKIEHYYRYPEGDEEHNYFEYIATYVESGRVYPISIFDHYRSYLITSTGNPWEVEETFLKE